MSRPRMGSSPPRFGLLKAIDERSPSLVRNATDVSIELGREKIKNEQLNLANEALREDIGERKKYAMCFFILCCVWLLFVGSLLIFEGFSQHFTFALSDHVLGYRGDRFG